MGNRASVTTSNPAVQFPSQSLVPYVGEKGGQDRLQHGSKGKCTQGNGGIGFPQKQVSRGPCEEGRAGWAGRADSHGSTSPRAAPHLLLLCI